MNKQDPIPGALKDDPQAARLLKDPAALKGLLVAPETQQLMRLLSQQGGDGLQKKAPKGP